MTADRLDAEAEARIRELIAKAQGTADLWNLPVLMRAAILADREAREKSTLFITYDEAATQADCDAFIAALSAPGNKISMVAIHDVGAERAHADALAEALRLLNLTCCEVCQGHADGTICTRECLTDATFQCGECAACNARSLLAAHDKRRGK